MPQPEPASVPDWGALQREVRELEKRLTEIRDLVDQSAGAMAIPLPLPQPATAPIAARPRAERPSSLLPLAGRALLGMAGAYLLRALTEGGTLATGVGVGVGLLYAIFWLVWAARTPAERKLETGIHSVTSAMVLAPLLWEATLHFHVVSTWAAGAILLVFTVTGLVVSWQKNVLVIATVAMLTGLGTSAGLLVATHDAMPFTFVFLAAAAAVETSACLEHWLSERWLAAIAADLSVLFATWLVTNERGLPESYVAIGHGELMAAQAALLGIYLASIIIRTLVRGFTFTGFETAQCALAFLIGVGGGLRVSHNAPGIAAVALACAAACYLVSFARLDGDGGRGRNFYTYSTFGLLLALTASRILLSGTAAAAAWIALAVACIWAGGRMHRLTLQLHGGIYLLIALTGAGVFHQAGSLLLVASGLPAWNPLPMAAAAAAAILCYWLAARSSAAINGWAAHLLLLAVAGASAWLVAAFAAGHLTNAYHAVWGGAASHAYCATLRTSVLALTALLLAWAGSRWSRTELIQFAYPLMAAGAYRLLMEDLHQDRKAALFLSLLVYGAALIALPRLIRTAQEAPADEAAIAAGGMKSA